MCHLLLLLPSPTLATDTSLTWGKLSRIGQTSSTFMPLLMLVPQLKLPSLHPCIFRFYSSFIFARKSHYSQDLLGHPNTLIPLYESTMTLGVHFVSSHVSLLCIFPKWLIETYKYLTFSFKISVNICVYNAMCQLL